jgi:chemotaxis protein MotA
MDITTIIGIISGISLVFLAVRQNIFLFWSIPSLMITFGGALAATLINYPLPQLIRVLKVANKAFFSRSLSSYSVVVRIVALAEKARREGILALENESTSIKDSFLQKSLQYVIDGTERDVIRDTLTKELIFLQERHSLGQEIFVAMGTYCPAFGMIGTLMGLILMLNNLDDPKKVGPGMALAIITTFYGALASYLICLPIAGKLKVRSQEEVLRKEVILEGVLAIQSGEAPRILKEKLDTFIAPRLEKIRQLKAMPLQKVAKMEK